MSEIIREYKKWGGFAIDTNCDFCNKVFSTKKSEFVKKKKHFCSMKCYSEDRKNWPKEKQHAFKHGLNPLTVSSNWRKRNRGKVRHYKLQYYARKKGASGSYSNEDWEALKVKYGNKCAICKQEKELTRDHIKPLSKGGSNYIENIQPLCRSCNSRKNNIYENPELLK